jgi:hypothetical protein
LIIRRSGLVEGPRNWVKRWCKQRFGCLVNKMKLANRMGRGYSFEVIRARILYAPENAKTTTLRRGILRDQQAYYMFPPARPRPDYFSGVKISTLVTAIRNDHCYSQVTYKSFD